MSPPPTQQPDTARPASTRPRGLTRPRLERYPERGARYWYLGIVVLVTVVLYYQLYVQYAVSTAIIAQLHMTFLYFVYISVAANAVGAFASLVAGLADRWGRANIVVYGLLAVGLLTTFVLPNAPGKASYLLSYCAVAFVEGMILVATPALIRDFSPQLGRASAMGYWTMGPIVGSLVVTAVTSRTYGADTTWQDEIRFAGVSGLVLFVIALFGLRELAPALRDQIMVSVRDRALIEARAKGIAADVALHGQWRQMMRLDVIGSAVAISLYLLLYYAAVGNFVVYFATAFGYSAQRANALLDWYWGANAIALVVAGLLSDRLRVRKPFMLLGGLGSIGFTLVFTLHATQPHTGYYTFALVLAGIGVTSGIAYSPWMASFTETVERHNPAATATGLAVWGWIVRITVALSAACVPLVVNTVTPLIEHGAEVQHASVQAAPALAITRAHPKLFAELDAYAPGKVPPSLSARAQREVGADRLNTVRKAAPQLKVLREHGPEVARAGADNAGKWQTWWWVCLAGQVLFLPFVFVMTGRWRPRDARRDLQDHEEAVARQVAALRQSPQSSQSPEGSRNPRIS
ncbi:MFS transporter [Streptomyces sp. SID10853]|uniref:MFS transporter n=1 Tax=Streptomyces sp. SID10853 TaxID=2706028 RepID=UPI0013BFB4D3|nr:MFS transporter [Streptomyces sp. SID10853]NDZ79354.1 MFS transporter [Streptomyces sp. SID10853]